jgi:predicted DNA-binding transcriptional regulator YafY
MKKVERINIIMRYINNRAHFTITEIMHEFDISRSTAIRDIREIEAMGMPLVAEVGRDGGYFVMNNSVLYLILSIVGLGVVTYALVQSDVNKLA